jgi:hypothetical protein
MQHCPKVRLRHYSPVIRFNVTAASSLCKRPYWQRHYPSSGTHKIMTNWTGKLRNELHDQASQRAAASSIPHHLRLGHSPTVLFPARTDGTRYGSFHSDSLRAIAANHTWANRLKTVHSQVDALPLQMPATAGELDSSSSSDALLMNCFCFPGAVPRIMKGLGLWDSIGSTALPEFGVKAKLPKTQNRQDATELNMKISSYIFEAKLTESDFTSSAVDHVREYTDFDAVFESSVLPVVDSKFKGYQLICNVLAAFHLNATLIVLLDQRRPDLLQEWWLVHSAIRDAYLRQRCGFRTWQQVAAASPPPLAAFLSGQYGI